MVAIWKNIYEQIKQKLLSGHYKRGEKFIAPADLARQYQVNYLTARRALKELVNSGLLFCSPDGSYRCTGMGQTTKIYFLAPGRIFTENAHSPSWMLVQQGVFEEALRLKLQIVPIAIDGIRELPHDEAAILLLLHGSTKFADEVFFKLLPKNIMPISIGAPGNLQRGIAIGSDNQQMMYDLTRYFLTLGCRHIAYVGSTTPPYFLPRFEGYFQALQEYGLEFMAGSAYTAWRFRNPEEIAQWIKCEHFDAICTPGIDYVDYLEQQLPSEVLAGVELGTIGKPNAIVPNYTYVRPSYIDQGNLAVRLALEADAQNFAFNEFVSVPAQLFPRQDLNCHSPDLPNPQENAT